jgi:hypothetical protein
MGYDMRWVEVDPQERAEVDTAHRRFYAACEVRDALPDVERGTKPDPDDWEAPNLDASERYKAAQQRVHAAYDAMSRAEKSYFRLNIGGMGRYCRAMVALGMAYDGEHPAWPEYPRGDEAFDRAYERIGCTDPIPCEWHKDGHEIADAELAARAKEHHERVQEILRWHDGETPGIPLYKFGSNDGWHVLPAEAEAAVRIYAAFMKSGRVPSLPEHVRDVLASEYWQGWIAYLTGSVSHGGFEVY